MEHKHKYQSGNKRKESGKQQISGEEYLRRLEFYRSQMETEQQKSNEKKNDTVDPVVQQQKTLPDKPNPVEHNKKEEKKSDKANDTTQGKTEEKELSPYEQFVQFRAEFKSLQKKKAEATAKPTETAKEIPGKGTGKEKAEGKKTLAGVDQGNKQIKSKSEALPDGKTKVVKADGARGSRETNVPNKQYSGIEQQISKQIDQEAPLVKSNLSGTALPAMAKNKKAIEKTRKAEKQTKPATEKLKESKKAEEIPQKASNATRTAANIKDLGKKPVQGIDKGATNQTLGVFKEQLKANLPQTADDLGDEGFMEKFNQTTNRQLGELFGAVEAKTQEAGSGYKAIENPGEGNPPRTASQLPELEKAEETPLMKIDELKVKVPDEQLRVIDNLKSTSAKILKREGIGESEAITYEDFRQAKSESLRQGIDAYEKIQHEADKAPDEVHQAANARNEAMVKDISAKEQAKRREMRVSRDEQLKASREHQTGAKSNYEKQRADVTAKMEGVFNVARQAVAKQLGRLDTEVKMRFDSARKKAMHTFAQNIEDKLGKFHRERYLGDEWNLMPGMFLVNMARWVFEDTSNLPQVLAIFEEERQLFIRSIDKDMTDIMAYAESEVAACKGIIDEANAQLEGMAESRQAAFKKISQEVRQRIQKKLSSLNNRVDKKATELREYLESRHKKAVAEITVEVTGTKEHLKNLLNQETSHLLDGAYKFFKWVLASNGLSTEQIDQVIDQGKEVLTKIVTDPMGFFNNMVVAVTKGFSGFAGNIGKHLKNGLFTWLTGAMSGAGLELPQKWDMKGIFSVILQVLGLTWTNIRAKIAKEVGEENLAKAEEAAETGMEIFQQIKEKGFVETMWDMLVEKAGMIKEMVVDEIKNWLMVKVVKQAITKILSMLNPAGAVVQAILAIYNFAAWLIDNWERMMQVITNIVQSVGKIAAGMLDDAARFVENTLASFVPMVLDFLARLMGLGNVSESIKKIMLRLRKPVDNLLDSIIGLIGGKFGGKKKSKPVKTKSSEKEKIKTKEKGKEKEQNDKDKKKQYARLNKIRKRFRVGNEKHTLYIEAREKEIKLMVASDPKPYKPTWERWRYLFKNIITGGYHGSQMKQEAKQKEKEEARKAKAKEALVKLPALYLKINDLKANISELTEGSESMIDFVPREKELRGFLTEMASYLDEIAAYDLLLDQHKEGVSGEAEKEYEKAWTSHLKDRKRIDNLLAKNKNRGEEGGANEDERLNNLRISNSIEWIDQGGGFLFVLTPVGQMEQRIQANGAPARRMIGAYFPNPEKSNKGHIRTSPQAYNWKDLKDNKHVYFTKRNHWGLRFGGSNRFYLMDVRNQSDKAILETLVHETQHTLDRHDDFDKEKMKEAWSQYKTEFRAHYISGEFDGFSDEEGSGDNEFKTKRQEKVAIKICTHYDLSGKAWNDGIVTHNPKDTPEKDRKKYCEDFRSKVRAYVRPEQFGVNDVNSTRIDKFYEALKTMKKEGTNSRKTKHLINTFLKGNSSSGLNKEDAQCILRSNEYKGLFEKAFDEKTEAHISELLENFG